MNIAWITAIRAGLGNPLGLLARITFVLPLHATMRRIPQLRTELNAGGQNLRSPAAPPDRAAAPARSEG